jgi:hypothetical protein
MEPADADEANASMPTAAHATSELTLRARRIDGTYDD